MIDSCLFCNSINIKYNQEDNEVACLEKNINCMSVKIGKKILIIITMNKTTILLQLQDSKYRKNIYT